MKIAPDVHRSRRAKTTWVTLVASVALVFATLSFSAAAAAPVPTKVATKLSTPKLVVMPGTKQFIASWNKVPGANKYALQYARNSKFKKATTIKTAITSKTVKRLTNYRDYWVRVRAYSSTGAKRTSRAVKIRPSLAPPGRPVITTIKAVGDNTFKLGWTGPRQATALRVVGSYDNLAMKSKSTRFSLGVKPTDKSATITIPKSFQRWVGQGTGNPVYLQMWAYNSKRLSTSLLKFRAAKPPALYAGSADEVTFATYNVTSVAATRSRPGRTWWDRRKAVSSAAIKANASVLAVQELTTARGKNGVPQYQDFDASLRDYKLAYSYDEVGSAVGNQTKGDHIFYKPTLVDVLDSGVESAKKITPSSVKWLKADGKSETDRPFGWARMRLKSSGTEFYVVSIHLQTGSSVNTQRLRVGVIKAINAFIKNKTGDRSVPIIMMGDFNSDVTRYRNGAPTELIEDGYQDSRATQRAYGSRYATTNSQPASAGGFPSKPFHYKYAATQIDYILAKNVGGSVEHHNQVLLNSGEFDENYRGSDHNLQWAKLVLPRPLS